MPTPTHPTQRLDIEDNNQRQLRLRQLLQQINDSSSTSNTHADNNSRIAASSNITPFVRPGPSSSFDFGVRETHAVEPPSELLSRVESFLPQMEAANAELARRMESSPESVDIENLGDREDDEEEDEEDGRQGQYIEMVRGSVCESDLLERASYGSSEPVCSGVLIQNLGLGVFDIRRRPLSDTTSSSSPSASSDDDSHSTHSDDSDASTSGRPGSLLNRPIRPLPKRARPNIVVLNESTTDNTQQ
ncbi:hypothetical protein A7U60_g7240 [Sanghuangporus baumii]|uniref:Uncharacterized protein n=1 Tax=Sanghuangporus baumii TaxID=108892 RepID=A0A9Q5N0A7_SANBA|nr:hypothetical protein A7U60_g7240 [Sanghuangporus baumii]